MPITSPPKADIFQPQETINWQELYEAQQQQTNEQAREQQRTVDAINAQIAQLTTIISNQRTTNDAQQMEWQRQLEALRKANERLNQQNQTQERVVQDLALSSAEIAKKQDELSALNAEIAKKQQQQQTTSLPSHIPPVPTRSNQPANPDRKPPPPPKLHYSTTPNPQNPIIPSQIGIYPPKINRTSQAMDDPTSTTDDQSIQSGKKIVVLKGAPRLKTKTVSSAQLRNTGILPAGSWGDVSLMTGVVSAVGDASRSNPLPVLMRISTDFVMPAVRGRANYRIKGCMLIGSATGDLSASRVYVDITQLACVDPNNRLMVQGDHQRSNL